MGNPSNIPREQLGKGTNAKVIIYPSLDDLHEALEHHLTNLITSRAREGRSAVVVFPVGPIQFRRLAHSLNSNGVSCANLYVFTMDEYCDAQGRMIPEDHPLSLRGFFRREFLEVLDPDKRLPEGHWMGPDPDNLDGYVRRIAEVGGIDVVYSGFGINGHWAFNDPPEPGQEMSLEQFQNLSARVVTLSRETIAQMAMGGTGGDLLGIPPKAVTIGPRELLSAREIYCTGIRSWHSAVFRRALHGPITPAFPASLIQLHTNLTVTMTEMVAELPELLVLQRL